jgi:hypothetical protein
VEKQKFHTLEPTILNISMEAQANDMLTQNQVTEEEKTHYETSVNDSINQFTNPL